MLLISLTQYIDISVQKLDRDKYQYLIIAGSDGLWNVMGPNQLKTFVKQAFSKLNKSAVSLVEAIGL